MRGPPPLSRGRGASGSRPAGLRMGCFWGSLLCHNLLGSLLYRSLRTKIGTYTAATPCAGEGTREMPTRLGSGAPRKPPSPLRAPCSSFPCAKWHSPPAAQNLQNANLCVASSCCWGAPAQSCGPWPRGAPPGGAPPAQGRARPAEEAGRPSPAGRAPARESHWCNTRLRSNCQLLPMGKPRPVRGSGRPIPPRHVGVGSIKDEKIKCFHPEWVRSENNINEKI